MNKSIGLIIQNKREEIAEIARQNSIEFIGLFGSYSRGEQTSQSDLDLLIKFNFNNRSISLFSLYDIQEKLEKLFNKRVDIVTRPSRLFAPLIEKDLVTIYENR